MPRETTLQKYIRLARDESHCFNEGEIMRGMRNILHRRNLTRDQDAETTHLLRILDETSHPIDAALTAKGLRWFGSMKRADGTWRDTKLTREVPAHVREVIDHFDHFRFEGYYNAGNNWRDWYVPVYRVYAVDGANFAYCCGAWQSSMCGLELFD